MQPKLEILVEVQRPEVYVCTFILALEYIAWLSHVYA